MQLRQNKGGGTRDITLSVKAIADSIIKTGKELFFPGGISSFGSKDTMQFSLGNYKEDTVSHVVVGSLVLPVTKASELYLIPPSKALFSIKSEAV